MEGKVYSKDEQLLRKRLKELAGICYQRDIPVYSDFLTLNEQTIFLSCLSELPPVHWQLDGGFPEAERKLVCFLPVRTLEEDFAEPPFCILCVEPAAKKFASSCTHRDFLGSILNLGIERAMIGDLTVKGQECYLICKPKIADFICDELHRVRNNPVVCKKTDRAELLSPQTEEIRGSVASPRLDAAISLAFKTARSRLSGLTEQEKVFVNGRVVLQPSYKLKEGDIVSVRGMGKFRFVGEENQTKKGRTFIVLQKFI